MIITTNLREQASNKLRIAGAYHEKQREQISKKIGIDNNYLWYVLKSQKWPGTSRYMAPEWVIERIMEWK